MKFYMINFDTEIFRISAEIIEIGIVNDIYGELIKVLQCDSLEFVDYSDEIVMIIDENGKFKPYNPVFQLKTNDGIDLEIVGKILFARNVENEFSTDIGSIKYEDIFYLRSNLEVELVGMINKKY